MFNLTDIQKAAEEEPFIQMWLHWLPGYQSEKLGHSAHSKWIHNCQTVPDILNSETSARHDREA